jgi:hypothetical protein
VVRACEELRLLEAKGSQQMSSMLPGLEEYAETPFPAEYTPNFLTPAEADEFFNFFNT